MAKVWPSSSTPTRSCQTLSSTPSSRSPRAGPRGASQLWLSAVPCADQQLAHPQQSRSLAQRGRQETRRCHVAPPAVARAQNDVPSPPCLSRPAGQPGHTPPPRLEEQNLLRIAHIIPTKAAPTRPPHAHRLSSFSAGTEFISPSVGTAAPCQYHPSGTTSHILQCRPEKERQYRPCGNPTLHLSCGPCSSRTTPKAHAYDHTDGTFWAIQNTWSWHPPQCRQ